MEGYDHSTYGDRIADVYDDWYSDQSGFDPAQAVELLEGLAGDGKALELGIGTGRVAIPLAARGVDVMGIDASEAMVARMRAKPGGDSIDVSIGNFADVDVDGTFALIYVPFTTLFALGTQKEQVRCLCNVTSHLEEGGHFVMDAFVPDLSRYDRQNGSCHVVSLGADYVFLDVSRHDPAQQRVDAMHVLITTSGPRLYPVSLRYCWPSELDLMAKGAGLTLAARYGGYGREPFEGSSTRHVSVYRRADQPAAP